MNLVFVWAGLFGLFAFLVGLFKSRWLLYLAQASGIALAVASLKTPKNFQIFSFLIALALFVLLDFLYLRRRITF